jgi:excisionase family DNA binding protein
MVTTGTKIWNRFFGPGVIKGFKEKSDGKYADCEFTSVRCFMLAKDLTRLEDAPQAVAQEEKKHARKVAKRVGGDSNWISTEEAASRLGLPRIEVTIMCKHGKLGAEKDGRHWKVSVTALEQYQSR